VRQCRRQLLEVLDFEQAALVLVMGSPRVGPPTLGRLAVAEVEDVRLLGSALSSESKHCGPSVSVAWAAQPRGYLSLRNIGDPECLPDPSVK